MSKVSNVVPGTTSSGACDEYSSTNWLPSLITSLGRVPAKLSVNPTPSTYLSKPSSYDGVAIPSSSINWPSYGTAS